VIAALRHTQRHAHTVGSSSLAEELTRRSGLLHNAQHSQETNIHASGGIRNCNPSKREAAELRNQPRGHRNRPLTEYINKTSTGIAVSEMRF